VKRAWLLALAACGGKAVAHAHAPPVSRFAWDPPCKVPVTEQSSNGDSTTVVTYVVDVEPIAGGRYEAKLRDFVMTSLNGRTLTEPAELAGAAIAMRSLEVLPSMIVAADGELVDVGSIDEELAFLAAQGIAPPGTEQAAKDPEFRKLMLAAIADYWHTWVDSWIDDPTVSAGAATGALVHATHAVTLDGEPFASMMHQTMAAFGQDLTNITITGSRVTTYQADIEPRTLRPHHSHFEQRTETVVDGKAPRIVAITRDQTFDWDHATGCGK
jgi:hypothetical protein